MKFSNYSIPTAKWYYPTSTTYKPTRSNEQTVADYSYCTHHPSILSMKSLKIFSRFISHHNHLADDDTYQLHDKQLNRNLERRGFIRLPVRGDGNCLFYALAEGILHEMHVDKDFDYRIQTLMNFTHKRTIAHIASLLRQLCVDQWKKNQQFYSNFIDQKVTFLKEVKKFSKNGVSESILGDIVPLTICNALNIHVTIFTSVSDLPLIEVKSDSIFGEGIKTIYLAYNQNGAGHYDAAYRYA
ncbi:unnamed protein product [Didymodactylos carnosus]|uniref:OTU domain-containing protein n=1 Tax=Didymodactylos carnosus TaxID=1234261 RepID=A0A813XHV6_9BILA|nr:unnamed protein product [Didymodactylos carnosus]CAF1033107.1 unnamed protein product [Didymodactylos carnosus]CAF3655886.1 unnamed protein product [Didymodactylos carnosus]CAF3801364.1 unnamed protein product [Didymodactylos carnosus]